MSAFTPAFCLIALATAGVIIVALCIINGALNGNTTPPTTYLVKLLSPEGEIKETWFVRDKAQPRLETKWGGQTVIRGLSHEWKSISAPDGWALIIKEITEE